MEAPRTPVVMESNLTSRVSGLFGTERHLSVVVTGAYAASSNRL
jgi:hypothetical protein